MTPSHFLLRKLNPLNAFLFNKFLSNGQTVLFWWRVPLWVLIKPNSHPIESLNYCLCLIWFCFFSTRLCQIPWVTSITHALNIVFSKMTPMKSGYDSLTGRFSQIRIQILLFWNIVSFIHVILLLQQNSQFFFFFFLHLRQSKELKAPDL